MKTTKEMIEARQAYDRGEQIEYVAKGGQIWEQNKCPLRNWLNCDYFVKKKFVPFDTAEEFLEAQREHDNVIISSGRSHAYIDAWGRVVIILNEKIYAYLTLDDLLSYEYKFLDGTPCGKEAIEE